MACPSLGQFWRTVCLATVSVLGKIGLRNPALAQESVLRVLMRPFFEDDEAEDTALAAISPHAPSEPLMQAIGTLYCQQRPWAASQVARALARQGECIPVAILRQALQNPDMDVRESALLATHDAAQYLGSMHQSAQQITDRKLYLIYKGIVITYIQSFAQQLVQYSHAIRTLFLTWTAPDGKKARLLDILQASQPPHQVQMEHLSVWHEDLRQQVEALQGWFLQESNLTLFSRSANEAIRKVVHRAHTLADSLRPQTDYVGMLSQLAGRFMQVDDLEMAQQIYAVAFASTTPIHPSESFAGSPAVADTPGEHIPWLQPPTVVRSLRPIARGSAERNPEQPMRHSQDASYDLKRQHEAKDHLQRQRLARLFAQPLLDLGMLREITPDERAVLDEILDGCLSSPVSEHKLADGSVVTLLNRQEASYVTLHAADGALTLPRYRLYRQTNLASSRQWKRPEREEMEVVP